MAIFKRNLTDQLKKWKDKTNRLPLILWGARQVGKSTSVEAFGRSSFSNIHIFNFQQNISLKTIFSGDLKPTEILQGLMLVGKAPIAPNDLVFFDEIQECPEAVTSLKYFAEILPQQAVISAGSHLGLIRNENSFPVGKVEFLSLHPMTYFEFLENLDPQTYTFLCQQPLIAETPIQEFYHQRALYWLRLYFCVGGMPEAVKALEINNNNVPQNINEAVRISREIQKRIIEGYHSDFSKYSGTLNANHILRVFDASAFQLGQAQDESVRKFKFSDIIPRKKGFENIDGPLTWLEKSRLIIKTHIANRLEQPLRAFIKQNYFKVYIFDIGILNALLQTPIESILMEALGSYKGFLAENFVAQELFANFDCSLTGWSESEAEVEFIISRGPHLCPIEVKASSRSRRAKSLETLIGRYHPQLSIKVTGQNRGYAADRKILTLPIYMVDRIFKNQHE